MDERGRFGRRRAHTLPALPLSLQMRRDDSARRSDKMGRACRNVGLGLVAASVLSTLGCGSSGAVGPPTGAPDSMGAGSGGGGSIGTGGADGVAASKNGEDGSPVGSGLDGNEAGPGPPGPADG